MTRTKQLIAVGGIVAVLAGGGAAIATAQQDADPPDLDRAAEAAHEVAGDGVVTGVEQDDHGGYDVDVRHPDGTETEVDLDASFQVVRTDPDVEDDSDDGEDRDGQPLDAATRTRVGDAALAAVGEGTVTEIEADDGGYDVEVRGADGAETDVHLDADLTVVTTEADADDD